MRELDVSLIKDRIREMFIKMNYEMSVDMRNAICQAQCREEADTAVSVLGDLLKNAEIALDRQIPMCQDTGMAVVFLYIGQEVSLVGGFVGDAVNQGVREAYEEGYLRKSVVRSPIDRVNTKDNTPAVIHYEIVPGDKIRIVAAAKGFGSENMSRLKMLNPSDGQAGVVNFIIETVKLAGSNPCPPMVVGVGLGGTMEKAAILAKKALTRDVGEASPDPATAELEAMILDKVNELGIGPQGFGGKTTAFAVNIEVFPTHIAGLPVAVNINCHASRHLEVEL